MMFNKKMLGSCCVGLALLLSGEGFCTQKVYTVGAEKGEAKIAVADVENGIEAFKTIKGWEKKKDELSSYWDVYIAAYVMAQKGVEVGGVNAKMTPDKIIGLDGYDVYDAVVNFPGGENLFVDIYSGEYKANKPVLSVKAKSESDEESFEDEWGVSSSSSSDEEELGDDSIFSRDIKAADFLKDLKTTLKENGVDVKEFKLNDAQQKILASENDAELKDIVGDGFAAAFHLFAYLKEYYYAKVLPVPASLEKLRDKYFSLMEDVAKAKKAAGESVGKLTSLQQEISELKKDKGQLKVGKYKVEPASGKKLSNNVVVKGAFSVDPNELNGIAKADKGKVTNIVDAGKVGFYNKDEYGVHKTATEDKYVKATHGVYATATEDKYVKATHGVFAKATDVAIPFAQVKAFGDAVDAYQQAIVGFEGQTAAAQLVQDINNGTHKGTGQTQQAAMHAEVDGLWQAIEVAEGIIKHKDKPVADLASAQVFRQLVTDVIAGAWANTTADENNATDANVKKFVTDLKTAANAKGATQLQAQGVGGAANEDAVRAQLLHAKLAGKSVDDIKGILDN